MAGFVATIQTTNGMVILVDGENSTNKTTGIYKINEHNVAIIFFEYEQAIEFCNEHLQKFATSGNFNEIITTANDALKKTYKKYIGKSFSIVFASVDPNDFRTSYFAVWMQNDKPNGNFVNSAGVYSAVYQDLCEYIISKTYSKHMSLKGAIDLMGYILLQCNKLLRIENMVDVITLSQKGIEQIETVKLNAIISKAESIDNTLKKDFSDFFINIKERKE